MDEDAKNKDTKNKEKAPPPYDPDALLTIDEVAAKLKIKKSWLYSPERRKGPGRIPCVKVGKYNRYHFPTVLKAIEAQQERS